MQLSELNQLRDLVANLEDLLDDKDFQTTAAAIGVLLTRFIAGVPPHQRESVLEKFMVGVREEVPAIDKAVAELEPFDDAEEGWQERLQ